MSYLRGYTQKSRNLTSKWKETGEVPSGWAHVSGKFSPIEGTVAFFYERLKRLGTRFAPGSAQQKALQSSAHRYLKNATQSRQNMAAE